MSEGGVLGRGSARIILLCGVSGFPIGRALQGWGDNNREVDMARAHRHTRGTARLHGGATGRHRDNESGIASELHIIDKPQVRNFGNFGSHRLVNLQREALEADCTVERRKRGFMFTSCDTGPAGVYCRTLDEVDEEMDNFRY